MHVKCSKFLGALLTVSIFVGTMSTPLAYALDVSKLSAANTRGYYDKTTLMEHFELPATFNVNDPAYPSSYQATEEVKAQQRANGEQQINNILQAVNRGDASYTIPTGIYRLYNRSGIVLENKSNFTIYAQPGVEFYMELPPNTTAGDTPFLVLRNCENVRLIGDPTTRLIVDYDPFNSTQGQIVAVDKTDPRRVKLDIEIQSGYVGASGELLSSNQFASSTGTNYKIYKPDGSWLGNGMEIVHSITHLGGNKYRLDCESGWFSVHTYNNQNYVDMLFNVGYYVSLRFDRKSSVSLTTSKDIHIENFATYGADFFIGEDKSQGSNFFTNIRGGRRPGTGRLSGVAGSQQTYDHGGPVYDNVEFGETWDDLFNVCDWGMMTYMKESDNTVLIFPKGTSETRKFVAGKKVSFYDLNSKKKTGEGYITGFEIFYDPDMCNTFRETCNQDIVPMVGDYMVRVTFDRNVNTKATDVVQIEDSNPSDVIIRNSYLHDGTCRVLINGSDRVLLENNVIDRTALSAIVVDMSSYWMEGAATTNLTINDNLIIDGRFGVFAPQRDQAYVGAISITPDTTSSAEIGYTYENIAITNNTIVDADNTAVLLARTKNALISGNTFVNPAARRWINVLEGNYIVGEAYYGESPLSAVYLHSVQNVIVENNVVQNGNGYVDTFEEAFKIGKTNADDANIVIRNNTVNGETQTTPIVKGSTPQYPVVTYPKYDDMKPYLAIVNETSNKSMDAYGGNVADYGVVQHSNDNHPNQSWYIEDVGDNYYQIVYRPTGRALDSGTGTVGANVTMTPNTDKTTMSQHWYFAPAGDGKYYIVSRASGLVLSNMNGSMDNGVSIQLNVFSQSDDNRWSVCNIGTRELISLSTRPYSTSSYTFASTTDSSVQNVVGTPTAEGTTLTFDGSSALELTNVLNDATNYSIAFRMKTTQIPATTGVIWYNGVGLVDAEMGGVQNDFGIGMVADGRLCFGDGLAGGNDVTALSTASVNDGKWHSVLAVRDNGTLKLYIDGQLDAQTVSSNTAAKNTPTTITVGSANIARDANKYFNGSIAGLKIMDYAISAEEVYGVSGAFALNGPYTPSITNLIGAPSVSGGLATFDGFSAIEVDNVLENATDYTIAFEIKTSQQPTTTGTWWFQGIGLVDAEMGGVQNDFGVAMVTNGYIAFGDGESGAADEGLVSSTVVNDGSWHKVVATRSGSAMKLYIDGVKVGEKTVTHVNAKNTPSTITLGCPNSGRTYANHFEGQLDRVQIFDFGFTEAQCAAW